jgi:hypothetical protein
MPMPPAPQRDECCNCHRKVGDGPRRQPFFVDNGHKGHDTWCPTCFFHVRAPKEPGRWKNITALTCDSCKWESVLFGMNPLELPRCPKCNGPRCKIPAAAAVELLKQALSNVAP